MRRTLIAITAAALTLVGVLSALDVVRVVRAQDDVPAQEPPPTAGPAGRVAFAPELGEAAQVGGEDAAVRATWGEQTALAVQNAGTRPTRFLVAYRTGDPAVGRDDACPGCRAVAHACSLDVAPGDSWRFPVVAVPGISETTGLNAVVYSLNTRPATQYGPSWTEWLTANGYDPEVSLADVACDVLGASVPAAPEPTPSEPDPGHRSAAVTPAQFGGTSCDDHRRFHRLFVAGGPFAPGLSFAPFRGEPFGAAAAVPARTEGGALALDRYRALPLHEVLPAEEITATGALTPGGALDQRYHLPGVSLGVPQGDTTWLQVQNVGLGCATVRVEAYRTNQGPVGEPVTVSLAAGGVWRADPGQLWPAFGTGAVRLSSNGPLAAAVTSQGFDVSAAHTGLRERTDAVTWALPLAYQEPSPVGEDRASVVARAVPQGRHGPRQANGWETEITVMNAHDRRDVTIWAQTAGRAAREIGLPIDAWQPTVLQLGFGLREGGFGWSRLWASGVPTIPMYVASRSLRGAEDQPSRPAEQWATAAWPHEPNRAPPRALSLPDLGGPALGPTARAAGWLTATLGVTDALEARVALQNLDATRPARVALDSYAGCGPAGTITRTIDPLQTLYLPAPELPGARHGANTALVRVLEGTVAGLAEVRRPEWPTTDALPTDYTAAYLAAPVDAALDAPTVPPASIAVAPTAVEIDVAETTEAAVEVTNTLLEPRCLAYEAEVDAEWLSLAGAAGAVPGTVRLAVDRRLLGPGAVHTATLTIRVPGPAVSGGQQTVPVTVVGRPPRPAIYLPFGLNVARLTPAGRE